MFALHWFTHHEVSNEANEEDQRKDKKSHSEGDSQDSCPKKISKILSGLDWIPSQVNVSVQNNIREIDRQTNMGTVLTVLQKERPDQLCPQVFGHNILPLLPSQ